MSDTMGSGSQGSSSGGDAQSQTVAALQEGAGGSGDQTPAQQSQPTQTQQQTDDGLATGFLSRVDPAHRPIVEPYVKQWDAGVSRRFQELHSELAPWKALGVDPDTVTSAMTLYQMIDDNPQQVVDLITQAIAEETGQLSPGQGIDQPLGQPPGDAPGISPELQQRLDRQDKVLEAIAQHFLGQQQEQQQAQEDQQLDQYLGLLKQEYGEFDEDYVIAKMLSGMSGDDAVKAYSQAVQSQVNARAARPQVPTILGGGGSVPNESQSIAKASRGDVKSLVTNLLQANSS